MKKSKSFFKQYALPLFALMVFLFLYIPIAVLIIFSFNKSPVPYVWTGFSFQWYASLVGSVDLLDALTNSLIVATTSMTISIVLGLLFVVFSNKLYMYRLLPFFYAGLAIPEIVVAVGLLSLFTYFFIPLGLTTIIAGHTLIGLGYVVPIIQSSFIELDVKYTEASLDLGATQMQTLGRIIIPLLSPSLIASALLVFIISLDDFVIAFFTASGSTQTLPMYIFSVIRSGATPAVNALSTLLLLVSSFVVMLFSFLKIRKMDVLQ